MEGKQEKSGIYQIEKENPDLLDDYRYADYRTLQIPFYGYDKPPIQLAQDLWLGKGGIFWDAVYFWRYFVIGIRNESLYSTIHFPLSQCN